MSPSILNSIFLLKGLGHQMNIKASKTSKIYQYMSTSFTSSDGFF